jgi:hypothetical protein
MDLAGVERDTAIRKQAEANMTTGVSNSFVSGKMVDINHPPRVPYDPRKNQFPRMLYHATKRDSNWQKEYDRIVLYNKLHPEKMELLPTVPYLTIVVKDEHEMSAKMEEGWLKNPPAVYGNDEVEPDSDERLCSRGCGAAPHRGSCKGTLVGV